MRITGVSADALKQMGNPRLRIEGVDDAAAIELSRQLLHPDFFARTTASTWRAGSGSVDFLSGIPDAAGESVPYDALRARATFAPTGELRIPVASLDDIIESKTSADRATSARLSPSSTCCANGFMDQVAEASGPELL
ncbi:hypothetical protein [Ilumatobacter sp.]|uniref:hypothetical protein n=1 Tax=Ilumatobacter sp. TaxID=1967498 RepID=UPI003AF93073